MWEKIKEMRAGGYSTSMVSQQRDRNVCELQQYMEPCTELQGKEAAASF